MRLGENGTEHSQCTLRTLVRAPYRFPVLNQKFAAALRAGSPRDENVVKGRIDLQIGLARQKPVDS